MATISSAGLGSGLDVESIVTKLVSLERTPITQLDTQKTALEADLSAFGKLQSAVSTLRDASRKLTDPTTWSAVTASSSDTASVAVTAGSGAIASAYDISVTRLASAQQVASRAFATPATTVGQGTLTIDIGTWNADQTGFTPKVPAATASITIESGDDTLEKIRDKINAAGAGVTASIVKDASGARLTMRSTATGAENAFRVTVADDADGDDGNDGGLSALAYDPAEGLAADSDPQTPDTRMARNQGAANAEATINGLAISSASNTLADVMDGLTLTLAKPTTSPVSVTVAQDNTAIKKAITDFASAYNDTVTLLRSQTKYDAGAKTAGPLQGDRTAIALQSQLRQMLGGNSSASSVLQRLSDIGLDPQADGTLKVGSAKLETAVGKLAELKKMFSGTSDTTPSANGFAVQMRKFTDLMLGDSGALSGRQAGLRASIDRNTKRQDLLEQRVAAFEKRVRAQYTALDTKMGTLSGLSSYMTQQIAQFNKG